MGIKLTPEQLQEAINAYHASGQSEILAARSLKMPRCTYQCRLRRARDEGYQPGQAPAAAPKPRIRVQAGSENTAPKLDLDRLVMLLRRGAASEAELAARFKTSPERVAEALKALESRQFNIHKIDGRWAIPTTLAPSFASGSTFEYVSRPDNTFLFGACGDTHLGSKYERLDVLNDLYDRFEAAGVDRVLHTGNWIDGEARFNRLDLHTHGMDAQVRYFVQNYPERNGIKTFYVDGDDHEGWYSQREGVNIGKYAQMRAEEKGRADLIHLGYMEAHIRLVNANTGKVATLAVVHPGGGSAYADSYTIQKIVESLEGGEKPAVALYGHYHKLIAGEYRGVYWLQTGCTKGQDTFGRKKRLRYTLGGAIVGLEQDPETGAILGFTPQMIRYFNKGYYADRNNRWSLSDDVNLPEMGIVP